MTYRSFIWWLCTNEIEHFKITIANKPTENEKTIYMKKIPYVRGKYKCKLLNIQGSARMVISKYLEDFYFYSLYSSAFSVFKSI